MGKIKDFIKSINIQGVDVKTWVRTSMLLIYVIGFIAKCFDVEIPVIDENAVATVIVAIIGVVVFLQSFWKNNSFTESAQNADKIMREKKEEV